MEKHQNEIHAYLWRLLEDSQDAQDVLQETFLRAYRAYDQLNHGEKARPWLYRIATRSAYTALQRRRSRAERSLPLLDEHPDGRPSPSEQMEHQDLVGRVRSAVRSLPDRQRSALLLRKYQEMSYEEIGRALGCTPEAARAHVYQALRRLRARFPAQAEQERGGR